MSLFGAVGEAVRQGKEIVTGVGALDSGSLVVATPFASIDAVSAVVNKATAPTALVLSWDADGGEVTIYAWAATASGDTTLVADGGTDDVSYIIVGRRR